MADLSITLILEHIAASLPYFWRIVTAGTFLSGLFFAFRALLLFKEYAGLAASGSANAKIKKPLVTLMVAVVFLYWPSIFHASMQTLFGTEHITPFAYSGIRSKKYRLFLKSLGAIVQFVGYISFLRGWLIFSTIGQQGAKQGELSRGIIHIIAGLLAVNIWATWKVFQSLIGA